MIRRSWIIAGVALGLLILLVNTVYVVGQSRQAVVIRFGQPVRVVNPGAQNNPGLQVKLPFVEQVLLFDKRNQMLEAPGEEIIASDQQRLVVDAFVRYRITDPLQYYRTLRDTATGENRLTQVLNSSLRQQLGSAPLEDIVSVRRSQLMGLIRNSMDERVRASRFGMQIIDVRIKRADLPVQNQEAVYQRMTTARQQESAQIRAEGERQRREIVATATEEAQKVRGQGDAERARLFSSSFGRDPEFAAFYRSMQAYETALAKGDTTFVVSPNSEFFRYFRNGAGGR